MKAKRCISVICVSAMLAASLPMFAMAAAQTPEGIYADKTGIYLTFAEEVTAEDYSGVIVMKEDLAVETTVEADGKNLKITFDEELATDTKYSLELGDFKKSFMVESVTDVNFDTETAEAKATGTWQKTTFSGKKGSVAVGGAHYDIVDKSGDKKLYVSPMDPNNQYNARAYAAPTELFGKDDSYTVSFELTSYGYNALYDRYLINGTEVSNGVSVDNSLQLNMKKTNYGVINRYGDKNYNVVAEGTYYNDYDAETNSSAAGPKYMGNMFHTDGSWMDLGNSACTYYNYDALYEKNKTEMDKAQTRNAVIRKNGSVITVEYDGTELYSFDYANSGVTTKIAEEGLFTISVSRAHIKLLDDIVVTKFTEIEEIEDIESFEVENVYADVNGVTVTFNQKANDRLAENISLSSGKEEKIISKVSGNSVILLPDGGMKMDTVYKLVFKDITKFFKVQTLLDVDFEDEEIDSFANGTITKKDFPGKVGKVTARAKRGDIIDYNGNKKIYIASLESSYEEAMSSFVTPNCNFETDDEYTLSFKAKSFGYDSFVERFMIGGEVRSDGRFEGVDALWVELKSNNYQIRKYNKISLLTGGTYVNESVKPVSKTNLFEGTTWLNYYDGSKLNFEDLYNNVNGKNLNKNEIDSAPEKNVSITKRGNAITVLHDGLELFTYDATDVSDLLDGNVGIAGSNAAGQIMDDFLITKYDEITDNKTVFAGDVEISEKTDDSVMGEVNIVNCSDELSDITCGVGAFGESGELLKLVVLKKGEVPSGEMLTLPFELTDVSGVKEIHQYLWDNSESYNISIEEIKVSDFENSIITLKGTAEKGTELIFMPEDKISEGEYNDCAIVTVDAGSFEKSFKFMGNSGEYNLYTVNGDSLIELSFKWISKADIENKIAEISDITNTQITEDKCYEIVKEIAPSLGIELDAGEYEYAEKVLKQYIYQNREKLTSIESFEEISKKAIERTELLENIAKSTVVTEVNKAFEECGELDLTKYNNLKDSQKKTVCKKFIGKEYSGNFEKLVNDFNEAVSDAAKTTGGGNSGGTSGGSYGGNSGSTKVDTSIVTVDISKVQETEVNAFSDIENVLWAKDAILYLNEKGIVSGNGNRLFSPLKEVTREEFAKMVSLAFGLYNPEAKYDFDDVPKDRWSYYYIASLKNKGIINGVDENFFAPERKITREEITAILYRTYGEVTQEISESNFVDSDYISGYAKDAVAYMNKMGIINGYEDSTFRPQKTATRAEAAKMIYEMIRGEN